MAAVVRQMMPGLMAAPSLFTKLTSFPRQAKFFFSERRRHDVVSEQIVVRRIDNIVPAALIRYTVSSPYTRSPLRVRFVRGYIQPRP